MYHFKFLGLALSALMSFTPVNYDWDLWQFPQTRTVTARYSTHLDVYDIGYSENVDLMTLGEGLEAQTETAKHQYLVSYVTNIQCNQACFIGTPNLSGYQIDSSHYVFNSQTRHNVSPTDMRDLLGFTQNGFITESATFNDENSVHNITLTIPRAGGTSLSVVVNFPAVTQGLMLDDIANHTLNASSYLLRLTLNNQNIPDSVMSTYRQYIDNGDYSTAYNYITNYIDNKQINDNTETNTQVNNYETQHTDLNQYFTTENNFTEQVENDFNTNIQQLDTPVNYVSTEFQTAPFQQSVVWVTNQFNRLIQGGNNNFGLLLKFSLITGFILALIGRFKR